MKKNLISLVETLIAPIIESNGCDLLEVEYKKKYDNMNLMVYIDKEGGVSLDDCEKVHKAIDAPLDELDPTDGEPYSLSVSSPGLDRPLKNIKDYKRNSGKGVEIALFSAIDGKKKYEGIFTSWTDDTVTIDIKGELVTILKKNISIIRPLI